MDRNQFLEILRERINIFEEVQKDNLKWLGNASLRVTLPSSDESIVVHVTVHVAGEKVSEVSYPKNWWEFFRERWFPGFWLSRFPVKKVTWKTYLHYPFKGLDSELTVYHFYCACTFRTFEIFPAGNVASFIDSKFENLLASIQKIVFGEKPWRGGLDWRLAIYASDRSRGYADFT